MQFTYEITPRPVEVGGGWRLSLLEDGVEVGGGVFPPDDASETSMGDRLQAAYDDAESEAYTWLDSREA